MLLLFAACSAEPPPAPAPAAPPATARVRSPHAYWEPRSDAQLADALRTTCEQAVADAAPVLVVFSAPWCGDCRLMQRLEQQPPLRDELAGWKKLVIDVGRHDRHPDLLAHFGIGSIARWVATRPTACDAPLQEWPVLDSRTFEPATKADSPRDPDAIAAWLRAARG